MGEGGKEGGKEGMREGGKEGRRKGGKEGGRLPVKCVLVKHLHNKYLLFS